MNRAGRRASTRKYKRDLTVVAGVSIGTQDFVTQVIPERVVEELALFDKLAPQFEKRKAALITKLYDEARTLLSERKPSIQIERVVK